MKFTIDKKQGRVTVDGVARTDIALDALPTLETAVRWFGEFGEVDYTLPDTSRIQRKRRIVAFEAYQPILDLHAEPVVVVVEPETAKQIIDAFTVAIQSRLDAFARTRKYDSILSLSSYATDPNPKFAAEGQYGVDVRSATWATIHEIMESVKACDRPMPTLAEIEAELPVLAWPV